MQFSDSNFDIRINFRKYTQAKSCAAVEKLIDAFLSYRAGLILIFIYFNKTWRTSVLSECRANSLHQTRSLFQQQRRDACWDVQSSNRSEADYVTVNHGNYKDPTSRRRINNAISSSISVVQWFETNKNARPVDCPVQTV